MRKRKEILTKEQAIAYLKKVLKDWEAFADAHRPFKQALQVILNHKPSFCEYITEAHKMDLHDWNLLAEDERMAIVDEYKSKYGEFVLF